MRCRACANLLPLFMAAFSATTLAAETVEFDARVLRDRGIDPGLAAYFREAPRFTEGARVVVLQVNGQQKGRVQMTFNAAGEPCLVPDLLKAAGLRPVSPAKNSQTGSCLLVHEGIPGAQVQLHPGKEQVDLLVPTEFLLLAQPVARNFSTGGVGGIFNYDALIVGSEFDGQRSEYRSLVSDIGLNAGGWMLRSRQSYAALPDSSRFEHLHAYGMRTLEDYEATLQLGQLNLASPLFAGESFSGLQIQPEAAFARLHAAQNGARGQVEGVAYSSARIEVRQNGVMIYTTLVPGGPFTLQALPLLSNQLDLEVTVHEQDGQSRRFRVPAASLQTAQFDTPSGFSLAAGTVRRLGTDQREAPAFATLARDWGWGQNRRMTGGVLAGADYLSMGWGLRQQWPGRISLDLRHLMSREKTAGLAGEQMQLSAVATLAPNLSANVVAVRQSQGYRTLSDTGWNHERHQPESRSRKYWVYSLNGSTDGWGTFAATWSRYSHQHEPALTRAGLSWSAAMSRRTNLTLSLERDVGDAAAEQRGGAMYLTLNMALDGQRRVRSYLRSDERSGLRKGLAMSDVVSETLAYTLNTEHRDAAPATFGARVSALPRYTSLDLGIGQRDAATDFDLGLRGGIAFHREGVTLSPYPLRDTFAVLKAGDRSGLKLQTPQGPVWTDGLGYAVAASLPAYSTARVEVEPTSLPRNVEILDGYQEVDAGRGSVQHLDFSLVTVRRLLLTATMGDQQLVPQGLTVHDGQGEYLTTVLEGGRIFLPDVKPDQTLHVQLSATSRCVLDFALAAIPDDTALIESIDATCTPLILS